MTFFSNFFFFYFIHFFPIFLFSNNRNKSINNNESFVTIDRLARQD